MPPNFFLPCAAGSRAAGAVLSKQGQGPLRFEAEGADTSVCVAPSVSDLPSTMLRAARCHLPRFAGEEKRAGSVTLAGAGPGDADLLTLGTLKALQSAQAVLYDALVSDDIIALLPTRCIKICVGKRGDKLSVSQDKTNALMVRLARRGLAVVRLKGGDPSLFGRVEEERQYLEHHGIAHTTLAGVTAASAAAAQFAFPLTHRGEARGITFLTGRTKSGNLDLSDRSVADPQTSLVFYMSSHNADHIQRSLLGAERGPQTPVVIVENAGRAHARAVAACLGQLAALVAAQAWDGPVLIGVGDAFGYARLPAGLDLAQSA